MHQQKAVRISAVVATKDRSLILKRMIHSLAEQSAQPSQIIIIDGSSDRETESVCKVPFDGMKGKLEYQRARKIGAASQRNEGVEIADRQNHILFLDDDILFEPDCIKQMWEAIESSPNLGAVNAMITNQKYHPPGFFSRILFRFLSGRKEESYAGKIIGPGINLLPEDRPDLPKVVPTQWLNTTCTLYRCGVFTLPPFPPFFYGYSLMEDVFLSISIGKKWNLANIRKARIFHDSQPGAHKNSPFQLSQMELVNRHFIMTRILNQATGINYFKLFVWELFGMIASLQSLKGWACLPATVFGKVIGVLKILFVGKNLTFRSGK